MTSLLRAVAPPTRDELESPRSEESERAFWRLVFSCRHLAIAALGVAALVIPAIGEQRLLIAGMVFGLVLPYDLALDAWFRHRRRMPPVMAYSDLVIGAAFVLVDPSVWTPVLLVMRADLALAAAAFPRRTAIQAGLMGLVLLTVIGLRDVPSGDATVGVTGFAIANIMSIGAVSTIADGERRMRKRLSSLLGDIDAIVWDAKPGAQRYSYLSPAAAEVTGHSLDDLERISFWFDQIHPDDRDRAWGERMEALEQGGAHELQYRMITADGRTIWLQDVLRVDRADGASAERYRGVTIDVTDRKAAEEQVELYANVVEGIQLALLVARLTPSTGQLEVVAANPEARQLMGAPTGAGDRLTDALPTLDAATIERLVTTARSGQAFDLDRLEGVGGDRQRVHSLHAFPLPGRAVGICLDDVTGSAMAAAALRRQALHDGLTGLPNRTLLRDRLHRALSQARRDNTRVALMLMDLDHFKEVNDALGHQYGDRLLVEFSRRLQQLLRECDTIARLGGDEFALLLTTNATSDGATAVVAKVREALQEPFDIDGVTISTNASIGVSLFPDHADNADLLTQRADVAMYTAKRGGGGWAVYSPDHDRSSVERLTLLSELSRAIDLDELILHYQPVIDVRTRRIVGSEALIRWHHPTFGILEPGLVIELAELSGLIVDVARWVARTAVRQLAQWLEQGLDMRVAINLSVRNLYDRKLVRWLDELLDDFGVPHDRVNVELTESEVMDDPVLAIDVLGAMRAIGVSTSIDDFGTGYSSLSYLRRLPVTEIKIDRSFVSGMMSNESDLTIVRTVIDLAHNLDMSVLAEGVEDGETLALLEGLGCDRAQGYLIGKPMPPDEMARAIEQWHSDVSEKAARR